MRILPRSEHGEGKTATMIEEQTAKVPSDVFLWGALGFIAASVGLRVAGLKNDANFIGGFAPVLLILGLYNKVVKVAGHD